MPATDYAVLVKKKLYLYSEIPAELLDSLTVEQSESFFTDSMVLRLKAYIFGEELPSHTETRHEQVPATPWSHFKHRHAAQWWMRPLVKRRPPEMRTITLTTTWSEMAAYPWAKLRTVLPKYMGNAVRISTSETDLRWSNYQETDDDD